ncbi:UNVERIFIED_CONTAM: putative pectinesterase 29 [Sesamum calycinum]|uniref:Pectinesterase n=1 Tax=Sesamum calycinum TaxID=2727403 RepID=A0AAW2QM63_9LAMI
MRPAVAAMIQGDKSAFHRCGFFGLQDTLWDEQGRHYFRHCSIQGAVDFIFGAVVARALNGVPGYITAQGRSHAQDTNGFVFKNCNIVGNGKTFLGRPWREYARVVFYNTSMSSIVVPQGWDAWFSAGRESKHLKESEVGEEAKPKNQEEGWDVEGEMKPRATTNFPRAPNTLTFPTKETHGCLQDCPTVSTVCFAFSSNKTI